MQVALPQHDFTVDKAHVDLAQIERISACLSDQRPLRIDSRGDHHRWVQEAVAVPADEHVDARHALRQQHVAVDLVTIGRVAHVGQTDQQVRALVGEDLRYGCKARIQTGVEGQPGDVGGQLVAVHARVGQAKDGHLEPVHIQVDVILDVFVDEAVAAVVIQVDRAQEGGIQLAEHGGEGRRSEVELVVADGEGIVAQQVQPASDGIGCGVAEVLGEGVALEGVAGVQQQDVGVLGPFGLDERCQEGKTLGRP